MLDMNKVAKNIKNARTKKNMTQLELADIVGVSYQAVSNWERGNSMPDIGKISDIAKALDIDVTELLGNDNGTTAVKKVLERSPEPLTAEELTDVAPMLPPMELTEEVKKTSEKEKLNIKALVGLAPYLDEDYLDEIASRVDEADIKDLVPLAPYLSDDTMANISKKITSSNIMLQGNDLVFIDFGLGRYSDLIEDKAVDLLVLKKSLQSIDYEKAVSYFGNVLDGYGDLKIIEKINEIEHRGRYTH